MRKCKTVSELGARYGEPHHKEQQDGLVIGITHSGCPTTE
jgi:hypothetical protein